MSRTREIARLAVADVRHEWRMSLCMMLAILAIATPLLVFFGLKYGVIETLRHRLTDNPATMEILPLTEKRLDNAWFEEKRKDPRIAFVVPHTRRLAAQAEFMVKDRPVRQGAERPRRQMLDLAPTYSGDVLLERSGVTAPVPGDCVLTASAAAKTGASVGDTLVCSITRDRGSVRVQRTFHVSGILPERASPLATAYIRLSDLEQIERFKDGRAVPEQHWSGRDPLAYPVTPKVLILLTQPLDAIRTAMLTQNTGFATVAEPDDLQKLLPFEVSDPAGSQDLTGAQGDQASSGLHAYLLSSLTNPADARDVTAVLDRVRGRDAWVLPLNPDLRLTFRGESGAEHTLRLFPASAVRRPLPVRAVTGALTEADRGENVGENVDATPGETPHAPGRHERQERPGNGSQNPQRTLTKNILKDIQDFSSKPGPRILLLPEHISPPAGTALQVRCSLRTEGMDEARSVDFTVRVLPVRGLREDTALMPPSLLGVLGLLQERPVRDAVTQSGQPAFLLDRRGYSGFRMYAAGLEQVAVLKNALEAEGITVSTRADRIEEVLSLDRSLDLLFWIIAAASLLGGMGCLVSSVYANVERKRRELAVLRLIGVHGATLTVFPVTSALVLTTGGVLGSLILFHCLSAAINTFFHAHLEPGEVFCSLTLTHQAVAIGLSVLLALCTGIIASRRMLHIEPAESLRDE